MPTGSVSNGNVRATGPKPGSVSGGGSVRAAGPKQGSVSGSSARGGGSASGSSVTSVNPRKRAVSEGNAAGDGDGDDELTAAEVALDTSGYSCVLCLGTRQSPNPCPNRHKGTCLRFANATQCLPCRNYLNGPLKGKTCKVIKAELKVQGVY